MPQARTTRTMQWTRSPMLEYLLQQMRGEWPLPKTIQNLEPVDYAAFTFLASQMCDPRWSTLLNSHDTIDGEPAILIRSKRLQESIDICYLAAEKFLKTCAERHQTASAPVRISRMVYASLAERMFDLHARLQALKLEGHAAQADLLDVIGAEWKSSDESICIWAGYMTDMGFVYCPETVTPEVQVVVDEWAKFMSITRIEQRPTAATDLPEIT
jgi:hypothetical protein